MILPEELQIKHFDTPKSNGQVNTKVNCNMLTDDYRNVTFGSMLRGDLPTGFTKTDNQEQFLYSIGYQYDVSDKRVAKTDPEGDWTYYLRNAAGMDIGVFNLTSKDFEWYVFGGGQRLAALFPDEDLQPTWLAPNVTSASYSSTGDPFDGTLKEHCYSGCAYDSVHFFIHDHLGNTRLVYSLYSGSILEYVTQSALDYYPYGKPLRQWHIGLKERYQLTGNERDTESGLDYFNARFYDSDVGRFGGVDKMAFARNWLSPYNYVQNNPMSRIDPSGTLDDGYTIDKDGNVEWADNTGGDQYDVLYVEGDRKKSIRINTTGILSELSNNQDGVRRAVQAEADDLYKIFLFAASNSKVEWRLDRYKTENGSRFALGTKHSKWASPTAAALGYDFNLTEAMVHSHPNAPLGMENELKSMGYNPETGDEHSTGGDWRVVKGIQSGFYAGKVHPYYTYFPKSGNLYNVAPDRPAFIRNIQGDYKRFFFGTLNHQ